MLRIGLLGASRIAPKAVIAPAKARGDVAITAVAARDPAKAEAYAREHGIEAVAPSYEALVARPDVDLVYCALPPSVHLEPCLMALQAGKALLIEKPFAMNADQAEVIAEAANRAGQLALEAFHYRFHAMFGRALEWVRAGRIGRVLGGEGVFHAEIRRGPGELRWIPELGGGGTMDLGCYVVHALRTLLGEEPAVTSAEAELEGGVDAELRADLLFSSGATASTECSMVRPRHDRIVLRGEAGTLELERFVAPQAGGMLTLTTGGDVVRETAERPGSYDAQLEHVVQVMRGEAEPLTGGADAVANMRVLDEMRRAVGMAIG